MKTLIQCDFDGTITEKDISFMLLDTFADEDWRQLLEEYKEGRISVGWFNMKAFAMIKAERQVLLEFVRRRVRIRPGFREMMDYCHERDCRFVIVSNGLDFYIEAILRDIGMESIEVFAAQTQFLPEGIQTQYIGPDGYPLEDGFKDAYVSLFLENGYQMVYIGDGFSDVSPARQCHHIFATGELLNQCTKKNLSCTCFVDFYDVVKGLESLERIDVTTQPQRSPRDPYNTFRIEGRGNPSPLQNL